MQKSADGQVVAAGHQPANDAMIRCDLMRKTPNPPANQCIGGPLLKENNDYLLRETRNREQKVRLP